MPLGWRSIQNPANQTSFGESASTSSTWAPETPAPRLVGGIGVFGSRLHWDPFQRSTSICCPYQPPGTVVLW
jgi:hypothetical protein